MPMTNEQIVNALIAAYQRRGVPMTSLLSDPVFHGLSVEEKIEAIKRHASTILENSSEGWTSRDVKHVAGLTAITAGMSALATAAIPIITETNLFHVSIPHRYKTLAAGVGTALALGALVYGTTNALNTAAQIRAKDSMRSMLKSYVSTGNEQHAVEALSRFGAPPASQSEQAFAASIQQFLPRLQAATDGVTLTTHMSQPWTKQRRQEVNAENAANAQAAANATAQNIAAHVVAATNEIKLSRL